MRPILCTELGPQFTAYFLVIWQFGTVAASAVLGKN